MIRTVAYAALFPVLLELILRRRNPYRLPGSAFDLTTVHEPDDQRGWRPKPNCRFSFHHRYLSGKREVIHNDQGLFAERSYTPQKKPGVFRVLLFGGTTVLGWELGINQTVAAHLERMLARRMKKKIEVIPVAARDYSLGQLYTWYTREFIEYEFDVLVYFFNGNHPRRTITVHESGKPVLFSQPVYRSGKGTLEPVHGPEVRHSNDMVYLNADSTFEQIPGTHQRNAIDLISDHFHVAHVLRERHLGAFDQRKYGDRKEIKDIDKRHQVTESGKLPFHWEMTRRILGEWTNVVERSNRKFLCVDGAMYYHAAHNWLRSKSPHPYGFPYDKIPSRLFFKRIARERPFCWVDCYERILRDNTDTENFYIYDRYGYFTSEGARRHAEYIADALTAP